MISPPILGIVTYFFIGRMGDVEITAGFGFSYSLYLMCFFILVAPNRELVIIKCAKLNGAEDYKAMRLTFICAVIINYFIFIFACCIWTFSDKISLAFGMDKGIASISHNIVLTIIPGCFLQAYNECLKNYLIALEYQTPF